MDTLTATLLTAPAAKAFAPGCTLDVVTVRVTAFGETRDIEATVSYDDAGAVRKYHTGPVFVARVGQGFKSYPISATLWPASGADLKVDLRGFVLRRSVVANAWKSQAAEVTTRAGWMS